MSHNLTAPLPTFRAVVTGTKKPFRYIPLIPIRVPAIPLSLVKQRLLIDPLDVSFDEILDLLIAGVTDFAEKYTGLTFINQEFLTFRDFFTESFELRRANISFIASIKYFDIDNILQTIPFTVFGLTESIYQRAFRLPDQSWPSDKNNIPDAIQIKFIAGFGMEDTDIPADIRMALLAHVVSVFSKAGDCCDEALIPNAALETYRQRRIISIKIGHSGI
jgi:uncharacterized phiE125 gp8 family phage protein